jgi:membrane protein
MDPRLERASVVGRALIHEIRTEKITFLAGSIAYHAFLSLLPLFLLVLAVVAAVGDASLEESVLLIARAVLTDGAGDVLIQELRESGTSISVFGGVVLIWGTLRIFRGLDTAFSDIYESEAENSFVDQLSDGVIVLVTFAIALVAAAALESAFDFATGTTLGWLLHRASLVVGLSLVFFPMYYIFPDSDVTVREVLPGVVLAAVGLTAFESLFQLYIQFRGTGEAASAVGGILVLLTWLYFSGLVILLGAALNAVLSNRSRDVDIRPVLGGVAYDRGEDTDRESVLAALEEFERLYAESAGTGREEGKAAADVSLAVGDGSVRLPRPSRVSTETNPSQYIPGRGLELTMEWSADALGGARTASDDEAGSSDVESDRAADDRGGDDGAPPRDEPAADPESGTGDGDREGVEADGGTGGS